MQNTEGAEFVDGLNMDEINVIIEKGQEKLVESYSGFIDAWELFPSKMEESLTEKGIADVFVVGLGIAPSYTLFLPILFKEEWS